MNTPITATIECEKFYNLCQAYRFTPYFPQEKVCKAYRELIDYIDEKTGHRMPVELGGLCNCAEITRELCPVHHGAELYIHRAERMNGLHIAPKRPRELEEEVPND